MHLHEYQSKTILQRYGVAITPFAVASNDKEVETAIAALNLNQAVLKVQVHAGGRGKAGGVKFAHSVEEIKTFAKELIGLKIVNSQTGKEGIVAHQILLTPPCDISKEYYCAIVINREQKRPTLIISPEGGMEIEEIAQKSPDRILTIPIYEGGVFKNFQLNYINKFMGWEKELAKKGAEMLKSLAKAFWEIDASMVEINPLVLTSDQNLIALDAKVSIDDNAMYRQKELEQYYDPSQESKIEVEAKKHDLAYISLDGNIACMVNGAGLAMATMDIIHHFGAEPANFLDVGGSASKEKVTEGFKIIMSDPKVKAILVNIFGGIMNCDTIAEGLIAATKELNIKIPIVVRMEGTHVEKGRRLLKKSGLDLISAEGLTEAAQAVVKAVK